MPSSTPIRPVRIRLHRETVRMLTAPVVRQCSDTALCGPSRISGCPEGCETELETAR